MNIPTDFGERVRKQRQLRELNQRELAAMTDGILSQSTLARLEKGTATPTLHYIMALSWALGIDATELVDDTPLSERVRVAARGDGVGVDTATQQLLPFLQLRVNLDGLNA
ncbi:multiprotein-bridging factor 1 family protein [Corynebacterium tuberculostearicum]|uniref:helix-turn-helix domain-containing protein n=1 Tax=Corynebacterium tuberculostearicum TaxID=38304 RepID=UPI00264908D1|nr:helix-turn-helix transcriptional regulator [Corynebacterium tuberculostearicum]MDV2432838.1 helix-turn-helix transcriptional regulator [Corynebacterium tuberculostearicum]WKE59029.1 helix-turn-helix transcriptional regulator [Corynebacterium tuberculostearicum]